MMKLVLKYSIALLIIFTPKEFLVAQTSGTMLLVSNTKTEVILDGEKLGELEKNKPVKFEVSVGQHYLQLLDLLTKAEKSEIIEIEESTQLVLKFEFETEVKEETEEVILVADIDFNIPGLLVAQAEENFEYPVYYYAFEKGDEIVIDVEMSNKQGTNIIEVFTYPDGNTVYSNDNFKDLKNHSISINEKSIYGFAFGTKHVFDRDVRLRIEREPKSSETRDFNTSVLWKEEYTVETIQEAQNFFINGSLNEIFSAGKTRIELPVTIPENAVKWYYEFVAFRDEEKLESISSSFSLAADISKLIDKTGIISFGIDQLGKPPGSEYCDIYLLDHENLNLFLNGVEFSYFIEGTRKNYESGIVEIGCCMDEPIYLGISNSTVTHGIHVVLEIVAIIKEEKFVMAE